MSGRTVGLVFRKRIGDSAMKSVLAYCAERADDQGRGVWVAKTTMAAATEMSRATTYRAVGDLVAAGLLVAVGKRKHPNGETIEYNLDLARLAALPDATRTVEAPAPKPAPTPVQRPDASPVQQLDPSSIRTPPVQQPDAKASSSETQTVSEPSVNRQKEESADALSPRKSRGRPRDADPPGFTELWDAYPHRGGARVGRKAAAAAYARAVKAGAEPATIIDGARRFAASRKALDGFAPDPERWIKREGWADDPEPPRAHGPPVNGAHDPAAASASQPKGRFNGNQAGWDLAMRLAEMADGEADDPVPSLLPARH